MARFYLIYITPYLKIFPYDIIFQDRHFPGKKGMTTGFSHSVLPTVPIYEKLLEQNLVLGILHILVAIKHFQFYLKHIYAGFKQISTASKCEQINPHRYQEIKLNI